MNIFSFMKTQHKKNMKAMMNMTKKLVCKMERKERKHDAYLYDLEIFSFYGIYSTFGNV